MDYRIVKGKDAAGRELELKIGATTFRTGMKRADLRIGADSQEAINSDRWVIRLVSYSDCMAATVEAKRDGEIMPWPMPWDEFIAPELYNLRQDWQDAVYALNPKWQWDIDGEDDDPKKESEVTP